MDDQVSGAETQEIDSDSTAYLALQARAVGSNVNSQTLLATDYLNHFNEVIMLVGMIPDMPEMIEEVQVWQPKTYQDHFRDSSIADKDLAIEAYEHVPANFKDPFETTIQQLDNLVTSTRERLEKDLSEDNMDLVRENATSLSQALQRLVDVASGIIHGSKGAMDQSEIDALLGT